jgi:predicted Ser/Thr protein kinase
MRGVETNLSSDPTALAAGMVVGGWRVVSRHEQGSYGVVYRVVSVEHPEAGPFALKMARHPMNLRFDRERELLRRTRHGHVPRLYDSGWWKLSDGISFPYIVMEWIEGECLYEWAERRGLTSRQALRLMAQLARALEALHAVSGVHRDVKGHNVLVTEEGRAVLTDFGSGHYRGAMALTWEPVPPGTPRYWSPELVSHQWGLRRQPTEHYEAGPADDLYALGVAAYRMVTGAYPPPISAPKPVEGGVGLACVVRVPSKALAGVAPELAALLRRMLSNEPSVRASAGELAEALEKAAESVDRRLDQLIHRPPMGAAAGRLQPVASSRAWVWRLGAVAVISGLAAVVLSRWRPGQGQLVEQPAAGVQRSRATGGKDEAVGMAEAALAGAQSGTPPVEVQRWLGRDMPKKPLPGQRQSPCGKYEIEINGGCWARPPDAVPPCGPGFYTWQNGCYAPTYDSQRPPTADQP